MRKIFVSLFLLSAVFFAEEIWEGNFEHDAVGTLPGNWSWQNDGVASVEEISPDGFDNAHAIFLQGGKSASNLVWTGEAIAVSGGDVLVMETTFQGEKGNAARLGYVGHSGDGVKCAQEIKEIAVTEDGWDTRQVSFIVADGVSSVSPCFSVKAGQELEYVYLRVTRVDDSQAFLYSPVKAVEAFRKACDGENLARGIPVSFNPKPNYALTVKGGSDDTDLTDGVFAKTQQIWFEKEAVGFERAVNGVSMMIDLGEVKPVRKAVIRLQGGIIDKYTIAFPDVLEVWASKDGRNFYRGQSLQKVRSTELELCDWRSIYYLPESTTGKQRISYMYPFELSVNADARYIVLRSPVDQFRNMFSDELAVIAATEEEQLEVAYDEIYHSTPVLLIHDSLVFKPKMPTFYLAEGLFLPNYLVMDNQLAETPKDFSYAIELPAGVEFRSTKAWPSDMRNLESVTTEAGRTSWKFTPKQYDFKKFSELMLYGLGPFYFSVSDASAIPLDQRFAVFVSYVNGEVGTRVQVPLEFLKIPEVTPRWQKVDTSLWLENRYKDAPECNETELHVGLSTAMYFVENVEGACEILPQVQEAKAAGRRIRLELEPTRWLRMLNGGKNESRCIGCTRSTCLAYRGKEFQESVQRVKEIVAILPCEAITFDVEDWEPNQMNDTMDKCTRCLAEKEKRGYATWIEYFDKMQAEMMAEYTKAVREGAASAGRVCPRIGYYAVSPIMAYACREGAVPFLGYSGLYPANCDEIQNSFYGRGTRECHDQMREVYRAIGKTSVLQPWRSGGTGSYYGVPYYRLTEQHIVETLMNGAGGIQFFCSLSFESPLDFFYMARAFAMLSPYEDILWMGALDENVVGDNGKMIYTARRLDKKMLFLAGNYGNRNQEKTSLTLPGASKATILSATGSVICQKGKILLEVAPDDFVLCLLEME